MSIRTIAAACVVMAFSGLANGQPKLVAPLPVNPPQAKPLQREEAKDVPVVVDLQDPDDNHSRVKGLWSDFIGTSSVHLIDGNTQVDQDQRELLALSALVAVHKQMVERDIARNDAKAAHDKVYWLKVALAGTLALAFGGLCLGFRWYRGVIRERNDSRAQNQKLLMDIYFLREFPEGAKKLQDVG